MVIWVGGSWCFGLLRAVAEHAFGYEAVDVTQWRVLATLVSHLR